MAAPVSLASVLGERKVPESVALVVIERLLEGAGSGIHPDSVWFQVDGSMEVQASTPSPGYRAPENRGNAATEAEDVYVIGSIFYELLSGRRMGQLPEREILHAAALDRALDEMEELTISSRMLLKAMLSFRPESRVDAPLALTELKRLQADGPTLADWVAEALFAPKKPGISPRPPKKAQSNTLGWILGIGCLMFLTASCVGGLIGVLWGLTSN